MLRTLVSSLLLLLLAGSAMGEPPPSEDDKRLSGMSIVGNDETPKSLVIVPWKVSPLGQMLGVSRALDDGRQPVDRDVFIRLLDYYAIGAESHAMHRAETQ